MGSIDEIGDMNDILNSDICSYYDIDQLGELLVERGNLIVVHHNIRSFSRNFDQFSSLFAHISQKIDVLVLSETWFSDMHCGDIEGYVGYHSYRDNKRGGGVSVYVRDNISCTCNLKFSLSLDYIETCCVEVFPISGDTSLNVTIIGIYRPPNAPLPVCSEKINNIFADLHNRSIILMGDFNVDLLQEDHNSDFFNNLYSFSFHPIINIATRISDISSSCLDQIWYNRFNVTLAGSIISDISDHYPVFAVFSGYNFNKAITRKFRDHSDTQIEILSHHANVLCNDYFVECVEKSSNFKCEWFLDKLWDLYNRHCPKKTKTISLKKFMKPWINNEIKRKIRSKHNLFKGFKRGTVSFATYNQYKNNLNISIRRARKNFFIRKFNNCRHDIKKTWKIINSVLSTNKKTDRVVTILDSEGCEISSPPGVSGAFCDYFSTVATRLDSDIPTTQTDPMYYMPDRLPDCFNSAPCTSDEVDKIILALRNKPCNINSIPIFIFKKLSPFISPVLTDIFNSAITEGSFPSILKIARIIPLFKNKGNKVVDNFRPISLLPLTSKIFEKLVKNRVTDFIEENNILYERQFGFRSGCSTSDAILQFTNDCSEALDSKLFTIAIFLDFSKAFDTVNKDIMIKKLDRLGFRNNFNEFINSYLSNRKIFVDVNNHPSYQRTTNIGLPQGSVSSPWLFNLYINDMHRSSDKLKFIHFADDTTIYLSGRDLNVLCRDICTELTKVDDWLMANRLSLNIDKTKFMIFTHNDFDIDECTIKIRDSTLSYVKSIKFLGIHIDDRLSYNVHLASLVKQLSRVRGVLYRISNFLPPNIVRKLYYCLFYSRMIYGCVVWGGGGVTLIRRIANINRAAINVFSDNLPPDVHRPLSFQDIYRSVALCTFHKYYRSDSLTHLYFHVKIDQLIPTHSHNTRFVNDNNVSLPQNRKTVVQSQFLFIAIKYWNMLPAFLKNIHQCNTFKKELKLYITPVS